MSRHRKTSITPNRPQSQIQRVIQSVGIRNLWYIPRPRTWSRFQQECPSLSPDAACNCSHEPLQQHYHYRLEPLLRPNLRSLPDQQKELLHREETAPEQFKLRKRNGDKYRRSQGVIRDKESRKSRLRRRTESNSLIKSLRRSKWNPDSRFRREFRGFSSPARIPLAKEEDTAKKEEGLESAADRAT